MTFDRPAINILGASVGVDHCAWKTPVTRWRQHRRHWAPTLFGARRPINSSTYLSPNIVNDNRQQRHYWCVIHPIYSHPFFIPTKKDTQLTQDEFINLSFQLVRLPAEFAHPNPELKFGKWSLPFPIESNVMAKASNPFPELVRSHGGVCIFPGILWQLVRNKVYEEYAVHAHLAWCQTCLIVLSENSRSFALKSNWVPLLPISWDFYQTRVKYTVSQKKD